ncbi:MAG TPA: hypothetical protein VMI53_12580 [Opitutaceae bacterium]|nr:hypothetical protein [Opitutaceae bacterium]
MLSSKSNTRLKIIGIEGQNADNIRREVAHGARFVIYSYNFSLVVVSFKRPSHIYFMRAGQSRLLKGLPFTLISLLFGWWGIPHGIIYTIQSLATNLGGGTDVTDSILASLAPAAEANATASPSSVAPAPARPASSPKPASYALAIGFIAALAAIIYSGVCYYKGRNLPVVLVSGLPEGYDVSLNGQSYHLQPHTPQILALPEGTFDLQARLPGGQAADGHFTFSTNFVPRPFHPRVLVLNPDKAAVVYLETTVYHPANSAADGKEENAYSLYVNQPAYFLDRPDFVFTAFPSTISMPEGTTNLAKTRLDVFEELAPDAVASLLNKRLGYAAMSAYLQNEARLRPDDEAVIGEVATGLHSGDALALFQTRLSDRPVHLEWHRYYQSMMEGLHPDFDLAGQYRRWAEAEPDNGDLTYLYARLLEDSDVSRPLFERALAARHSCPYAAVALGFDEINDTHFQRGLDLLLQAERAGVHSETLRINKRMALLALGRKQDVVQTAQAELAAAPTDIGLFADLLRLQQNAAPDSAAGERAITQFLAQFRRRYGDDEIGSLDRYLHASLAYGAGDEAGFARRAEGLTGAENVFEAAVSRRDHAAAAAALSKTDEAPARYYWILYLTARSTGDETAAEGYFQKGLEVLAAKEGRRGSTLARRIKSGTPADHAEILRTANDATDNAILFAALGLRFPARRDDYFGRARLFDVDPSFPHLLLRSILAAKPGGQG